MVAKQISGVLGIALVAARTILLCPCFSFQIFLLHPISLSLSLSSVTCSGSCAHPWYSPFFLRSQCRRRAAVSTFAWWSEFTQGEVRSLGLCHKGALVTEERQRARVFGGGCQGPSKSDEGSVQMRANGAVCRRLGWSGPRKFVLQVLMQRDAIDWQRRHRQSFHFVTGQWDQIQHGLGGALHETFALKVW